MKSSVKFLIILMLAVPQIFADGFIIIPDPPYPSPRPHPGWRDPFPLEVKYHDVKVTIDGFTAKTKIDQVFFNPLNQRLEGQYIFPIPEGAVITGFKMFINGKEYKAELLDAEKAKKLYQEIVSKSKDPALLEYSGKNIYTLKIFPIEPRSERKIEIEYFQTLEYDGGTYKYLYPLNTEKFSSKALEKVSVAIDIKNKNKINGIYSPTHETKSERLDDNHFKSVYSEINVRPDKDYLLVIHTVPKGSVIDLMTYNSSDKEKFFLLNFSVDESEFPAEYVPKDIVFVLDISGSMAGEKMTAAQSALVYCINRLRDKDNFQIIKFGTEAEKVFSSFMKADKKNKESAEQKIKKMEAMGGTNIDEALKLALREKGEKDRPFYVVFITDGKPTIGERDDLKLVAGLDSSLISGKRIFTFGIGYDINIHLLDKIALKTGGVRNYSPPNSEIEVNISSFFEKIEFPILTDVTVSTSGNIKFSKAYPNTKIDIFKGGVLTLAGLIEEGGSGKIIIKGKRNGKEVKFERDVTISDDDSYTFIPVIWSMRRVGHLLDLIRLNGESKEMIDEVVYLAKKYGLITPYTAYLILEDEQLTGTPRPPLAPNLKDAGGFPEANPQVFKEEFDGMKNKEGKGSTTASETIRDYSGADQVNHRDWEKRNVDKDNKSGQYQTINLTDAAGRAFYENNGIWIDSKLEKQGNMKLKKIKFESSEYFELAFSDKEAAQVLSLGRNVRFAYKGEIIEVIN
ncbi:MAG: VIT and VWA domain-containing protein [Bacteroidetes bacterium]|nr:VIT and VWA domain-containing protein [Bacteroidota bacterium]